MLARFLHVALVVAAATSLSASGSVTLVNHGGPTRYASLAEALAVAGAGDTLQLSDGVHSGPDNRDLLIDVPIAILGRSPKTCILDLEGAARAFECRDDVRLEGITIRNGVAEDGGALLVDAPPDTVTTLTRMRFEGNEASNRGGAVYITRGILRASDTRFVDNAADSCGGGIAMGIGGAPPLDILVERCVFEDNVSASGGGFCANGGFVGGPVVRDSVFRRNRADAALGGAVAWGGLIAGLERAEVTACTFSDNESVLSGGAVVIEFIDRVVIDRCVFQENISGLSGTISYTGDFFNVAGSSLVVRNSWMVDNTAERGAAVSHDLGSLVLQGTTVANNVSLGEVGAVAWQIGPGALLLNSILWGNESAAVDRLEEQVWIGGGGVVESLGCNIQGLLPVTPTNFSVDPLFVDAAAGDYHLAPMSPCIDAGIVFGLAATQLDIDGEPRLIGAGFDIGADEFAF